ncbi:hypothetical protein NEPAR06_0861 [Nematocida parisii]|uniref:uncharacterized protein n=1 Tax=Nematocida parisii (strain ERTm1 / ATCC PRA-289) TaxID=881290 RepID=UPI000264B266|nr:uncharacterized protein NEPG_02341 [Nematocida parisii ERTm1]EIJ92942.1 hypothetical protein NEPG_02341 [Nematocida parisii ERTm1]KAI5144048.1 hypothetical protein NEPAR07_1025 [Nematocida parisii]KAI5154084.1 hypothetical protein NEPAR06_0861 [Nematocida parisii]KAI5157558.1 hypothetical protein NEPAR05_1385 [Nematocida parisii]|eukprot:XP_013060168.1 hypothetical protein NEPG_02341 [Nematocida parisii ERTm1]
MQSAIKKEIGDTVTQKSLEDFFKDLFPVGDSSNSAQILINSLTDKSPEGLYELILKCRNNKTDFAKWIYKCIKISNPTTETSQSEISQSTLKNSKISTKNISEYLSEITAISPAKPMEVPGSEEEFINFCLSSKEFQKSWNVLRLSSF